MNLLILQPTLKNFKYSLFSCNEKKVILDTKDVNFTGMASKKDEWIKSLIQIKQHCRQDIPKYQIDVIVIKQEKTPEEKLKWQIESDLFYLFECKHCQIVTLIEESTDIHIDPDHPKEIAVKCPVCHTDNLIPKGKNRLKLKLDKIMKPEEINPYYTSFIKRSKKEVNAN